MRAIEHVHRDGSSSFEYTEATHGEWRALKAMEAATRPEEREAWIRSNVTIDTVHVVPPLPPEPPDDEIMIRRRR